MEVLQCHITIGNFTFDFVHELVVESSWMELTDKAVIKLPAALKVDNNKLKDSIPKGSAVSVKIGYESHAIGEVFNGFVSRIKPTYPIEIECEDLMWKLKQIQINENASKESMQDYLSRVMPVPVDCFDVTLPKFIAFKITGAQLLDQIKSDFGFPSFIRNGGLVVGKQYDPAKSEVHRVIIDQAFNSNVKSQSLEFKSKDDVKLKVTAISNMANGQKVEVVVGDLDGEDRTLNFFNLAKSDLQAIAKKEMERLRYDGYRGDLTLFGAPMVQHGDILELINSQESDKTGRYFIDAVTSSFGVNGFQQTVKLGSKA